MREKVKNSARSDQPSISGKAFQVEKMVIGFTMGAASM